MASSVSAKSKRLKTAGMAPPAKTAAAALPKIDRQTLWICLGMVIVVCIFYYPILHNEFIRYDDDVYILKNAEVQAGLTWSTVEWAFTTFDEANWHPLTWLSHALDCQLFGLNPAGPHIENVLLHAANAIVLFLLLQNATGFRWRSLMVAALFALHPINVESVAWAAERKNILSMLFFLLALYAYGRYAREPNGRRYSVVVGFYVLALLAKPQVITFPFLLWLWDYWPLRRIDDLAKPALPAKGAPVPKMWGGNLVLEKVPLLLLTVASAIITMFAQRSGGAVRTLTKYPLPVRLETSLISYARYLGTMFWPARLAAMYPHPTRLYPAWEVIAAAILLLAITASAWRMRETRYLAVGWFWFLGTLVPMIGLVQVGDQARADRYTYIPFLGLFAAVVWLLADSASSNRRAIAWMAIPATACLLALGALSFRQLSYWHDTEGFWRHILAVTDDNYVAHGHLAEFLYRQGKAEESLEHVRAVLAIRPDDVPGKLILADHERSRGNLPGAIEGYESVAGSSANAGARALAYGDLGFAYFQMNEPMKAAAAFESSLKLVPANPAILVALGALKERSGDFSGAEQAYTRAIKVQSTDVELLLLSHVLQQQGRMDEAKAAYDRAARTSPNLREAERRAASYEEIPASE